MMHLVSTVIDGEEVLIQASIPAQGVKVGTERTAAPTATETVKRVEEAFVQAQATITRVARSLVHAVHGLGEGMAPNAFELEFGISFSAEGNVVVAKLGSEVNLKVRLTYTNSEATTQA